MLKEMTLEDALNEYEDGFYTLVNDGKRITLTNVEEYQCMVCGKFVREDEGVTTLNGLWVCDEDICRTLNDNNDAIEILV